MVLASFTPVQIVGSGCIVQLILNLGVQVIADFLVVVLQQLVLPDATHVQLYVSNKHIVLIITVLLVRLRVTGYFCHPVVLSRALSPARLLVLDRVEDASLVGVHVPSSYNF